MPSDFGEHLGVIRQHRFTVARPVAEAFTLFEPLGEKHWAADWDPRFPTAADAAPAEGAVFTVDRRDHSGRPVQTVWMITRYLPEAGSIEYRCVVPGERVAWIAVMCRALEPTVTRVDVSYRYTGLSAAGDAYIAAMTEEAFSAFIETWNAAIQTYLSNRREWPPASAIR